MVLSAGKGAEASVLTRMIKPTQPNADRNHRSTVVLVDRFIKDGKQFYHFKYPTAEEPLMHASVRFVKVVKEGERDLFFDEPTEETVKQFVEPKTKWKDSIAKKKLYDDVNSGKVPLEAKEEGNNKMKLMEIYSMHPEYAEYDYKKFSSRLSAIRKSVKDSRNRAEDDQAAFDRFVQNNSVSYYSAKGYIQWQGSESQRLLLEDMKAGKLEGEFGGSKKAWYLSRPEFYDEFPLDVFRDKINQEIGTAKYLYTLKMRGKTHKKSS